MPSQVCNNLLEEHYTNERNASSDSGRAMAAIRTLGFLRVADYFLPDDVYNSEIDAEYRRKTIGLSRKAKCASCEANALLLSAFGVPEDFPYEQRFAYFDSSRTLFSSIRDTLGVFVNDVYRAEVGYDLNEIKDRPSLSRLPRANSSRSYRPITAYYHFQLAMSEHWPKSEYRLAAENWNKVNDLIGDVQGLNMQGLYLEVFPGFLLDRDGFLGSVNGNIGLTQRRSGSLSSALTSFQRANEHYKKAQFWRGQLWMLQMISQVHFDQGNFKDAWKTSESSAELFENYSRTEDIGDLLAYLESFKFGLEFYIKVNESSTFIKRANRGLELCRNIALTDSTVFSHQGSLHIWKSLVYYHYQNIDSAMVSARKALTSFRKIPGHYLMVNKQAQNIEAHKALGLFVISACQNTIDPGSGEGNKTRALDLISQISSSTESRSILRLADMLTDQGEYNEALRLYNIIWKDAMKTEFILLKREIAGKRAYAFEKLGDMDKAYEELELYNSFSDSIKNFSHVTALAEADARYRNELAKRENVELELENEALQSDAARRDLATLFIAGLLVLFSFSFFWYHKIKNKNAALLEAQLDNERLENERAKEAKLKQEEELKRIQAEKALTKKEREQLVTSRLLADEKAERFRFELQQKENELSGYAIQQLKNQQELEGLRQKIKRDLGESSNSELVEKHFRQYENSSDWEEFQLRMESVHPTFNKKLATLHGNLTSNEKKLCGLIRLNLTIKQIATLQNNSPESVNKARYRLRKKLELERSQDLFAYLESLTIENT